MVINNSGNINPLIPQTIVDANTNKAMIPSRAYETSQDGAIVDKIEISKTAKILSKALNAISQMPDIRQQEVDKAKERLIDNSGTVPASVLAAKLLLEE